MSQAAVSSENWPGAIPGGSTENKKHSPVVQRQRRLVHIQETMVRFHPGLLTMPRYANRQSGSAQTRGFAGSIPALGTRRNTSSWSSGVLACLSRRRPWVQIPSGTLSTTWHGTPTGRATDFKRPWLWFRLPPVLLIQHASAGHWRAPVAVTHPPSGCGGSTPSRRTDNMARSSNGSGYETLNLVIRVRLPYGLLSDFIAGATGVQPARAPTEGWSAAGTLGSIPRPATCRGPPCGRCPASAHPGLISQDCRVRLPDPLLEHDQVRKPAKRAGREPVILWVRFPVGPLTYGR